MLIGISILVSVLGALPLRAQPPAPSPLESGRSLAAAGAYAQAVPRLEEALKADSLALDIYRDLAGALLKSDQAQRAQAVCQRGLRLDSTDTALLNTLSAAYAVQGRYALAIETLETVLGQEGDAPLAHLNLGGLHVKLGQYPAAETHLRRARALRPGVPAVRRRLGELFLATGSPDSAAAEFAAALKLMPDSETLHFLRGKALEAGGAHEAALEAYVQARRRDPGFSQAQYRTALLARRLGRPALADSAQTAYARLQRLQDKDPLVGQRFKALRAALLDTPEEALHHVNLALFFMRHDYVPEALNAFARSLQLNPRDFRVFNHMGSLLLKGRQPQNALAAFLEALRLAPDFLPAHLNAGNANMLLGRPDRAAKHYAFVVRASPGMRPAWRLLVRAYLEQGDFGAAEAALALGSGSPAAEDIAFFEELSREIEERKNAGP